MARATTQQADHVDRFLESIREELPDDLDFAVEGIVDRIGGINRRIERMLGETLEQHGLSHGEWKVLNALRWAGRFRVRVATPS